MDMCWLLSQVQTKQLANFKHGYAPTSPFSFGFNYVEHIYLTPTTMTCEYFWNLSFLHVYHSLVLIFYS